MLFLFFLILLGLIGGGGYYLINKYERTISALKMKLNLTTSEMTKLIANQPSSILDNFSIDFLDFTKDTATLKSNSKLYLFPSSISPILSSVSQNISIKILVKASVSNSIWYFISTDIITIKGWVSENSLLFSADIEVQDSDSLVKQ